MSESSSTTGCTYRAFLSYGHADRVWADWLHKALETYRVPARLVGMQTARGTIPRRLNPIFRDREELASATDLGAEVNEALRQSENLIVICSPAAAASHWVNEEVLAYKRLGRGQRIFCLIVGGEPFASDKPGREIDECFCPALRFKVGADGRLSNERTEPLAADARPGKDGKPHAKLKLIAGMLGVGYDTLMQREAHRRRRRMLMVTAASVLGMAIATGLAITAYIARNEARQRQAQTEDALNFMLGDLHEKLEATGRLDLMAAVTDRAMALFAASKPGSLTDLELTQESQALVQIGEIRLAEGRYESAMDAFRRADQRSIELTSRHPDNGRYLFDRAQAEYWLGNVYRQQGNLAEANVWLTRYRDSTLALLKIDPHNNEWQQENIDGEHNLAVLALDRGDLEGAQDAFLAELAVQRRLMHAHPEDAELTADLADTISWLGNVAERRGDLGNAQRLFGEQVDHLSDVLKQHPDDFRWLYVWANAQVVLGASLVTTGRRDEAERTLAEAVKAFGTLTRHDPGNVLWRMGLANAQITRAKYAFAAGRPDQARKWLSEATVVLRDLGPAKQAEGDRQIHRVLSPAWLLRARIAWREGDLRAAADAANRSLDEAREETTEAAIDEPSLADRAEALLVLGGVQQAQSPRVSPGAWDEAHMLLAERASVSHYWRLLDPWLRLCYLTGNAAQGRIAFDRLYASGYVPLEPWPAIGGQSMSTATRGDRHVH